MDAYFHAMETMSEADIRGAMKNDTASFQMQWNAGKADKVMFCWWKGVLFRQFYNANPLLTSLQHCLSAVEREGLGNHGD
jgi:hypothetical protein